MWSVARVEEVRGRVLGVLVEGWGEGGLVKVLITHMYTVNTKQQLPSESLC